MSAPDDNDYIDDRSVVLALAIADLIVGEPTASVILALGKVLGHIESAADRPHVCGLMDIVGKVAHEECAQALANRRAERLS